MMGFQIKFLCCYASPAIMLQKPSQVPSCTSTCFGASFWKPSYSLIHREPLVQSRLETLAHGSMILEHAIVSNMKTNLIYRGLWPWFRPFPSLVLSTRRYSWLDGHDVLNGSKEALELLLPLRHGS
jgi:hypothetical protein